MSGETKPEGGAAVVTRSVEVLNAAGLHARPATAIATLARTFDAEVVLVLTEAPAGSSAEAGTRVDASSVMDLLFLAAPQGTRLDIEARGPDAEAAATAVADLFTQRFGID